MEQISEAAILFISKNFRNKVTLEELAKITGLSPFHFHRKFVEENDCTPQAYLENVRMDYATHMMGIFPNCSMTDIAFECGYSSPGIFSRAFKNYFGVAPSKYETDVNTIGNPKNLDKAKPMQIQYLSKKNIVVKKVSLIEAKLNNAIRKLIKSRYSEFTIYGFYLDLPFHVPAEKCRYFIGVEADSTDRDSRVLTIDAGYYTSFISQGDFAQLEEQAIVMNHQVQEKGYMFDSLIGFEKLIIKKDSPKFEYSKFSKEIFAKIKRG